MVGVDGDHGRVHGRRGAKGRNPYRTRVDLPGKPTHGHLRENRNHGGKKTNLPDARKLKDGAFNPGSIDILGFNYRLGDLRLPGQGGPPAGHHGPGRR